MHKTIDFDYHLNPDRIAQKPLQQRDASRLLVLHRGTGQLEHRKFADLADYLHPGDALIANDSRVIPARLFGRKRSTGGKVELLLLERLPNNCWKALAGGKKITEGVEIQLEDKSGQLVELFASVQSVLDGPLRVVFFSQPLDEMLDALGHTPLPPYIHQSLDDPDRYQTIFARPPGSAAAPTAGLHFTPELLLSLREKNILWETVTLHIGLDTFKPVEAEFIAEHVIHSEWAQLTPEAARRLNGAKLAGGRLVAVGTTSVRVLETAALRSAGILGSLSELSRRDAEGETSNSCPWRPVAAFEGTTDLYIYPGYRFRAVDALITNFHLPQSTLLMLVAALAGRQQILEAYQEAIQEGYRFYSFGDSMLIL